MPNKAPSEEHLLTPDNPNFERQARIADEIMREDRELLRTLAKEPCTFESATQ